MTFELLRELIENKGSITCLKFNYLQNNLTTLPVWGNVPPTEKRQTTQRRKVVKEFL